MKSEKREWVIAITLLILIGLFTGLQSCVPSCSKALSVLDKNCPQYIKNTTVQVNFTVTIPGESITVTSSLTSICDSLKYWNENNIQGNHTIVDEKKGNLTTKATVDKKTGKLNIECRSDTLYKPIYYSVPCNYIMNWNDTNKFIWHETKAFMSKWWWVLFVIIISIIAIKKLT